MTRDEKIKALESAGFTIRYADPKLKEEFGHVNSVHLSNLPYDGEPYVDLGNVAAGEDRYGQTSTILRSNYRILTISIRSGSGQWTSTSYLNQDTLGAFVDDLSEDAIELVTGLATGYPVLDEQDLAELESEEIYESYSQYFEQDTVRSLSNNLGKETGGLLDRWLAWTTEEERRSAFFGRIQSMDYYPEHDGLEVRWDSDITDATILGMATDWASAQSAPKE